jgi:hypothetical protein
VKVVVHSSTAVPSTGTVQCVSPVQYCSTCVPEAYSSTVVQSWSKG